MVASAGYDGEIPVLRLAVLCEDVEEDGNGRPYRLTVPVHTIRFPPDIVGRYRPPTLYVYVQLQGAVGTFYIRAVLREEGETIELYHTDPTEVPFGNQDYRVAPLELTLELDELIIPRPGAYELIVYANYVSLHMPSERVPIPFHRFA
jgi:hypothetical protein